jgi:diaminobutyrate-2-oxoglutarate transaminase
VLAEEGLDRRAARLGEELGRRLAAWPERFPAVAAVRGRGLLWGIEMRTKEIAERWMLGAWSRGVLVLAGGPEGRVGQIVPPLTLREEQLEAALEILAGLF